MDFADFSEVCFFLFFIIAHVVIKVQVFLCPMLY